MDFTNSTAFLRLMGSGSWLDGSLLPAHGPLVVAVSGGCDSMVLWALLAQAARWNLIIWHLDHGLRAAAVRDAELIRGCTLPGLRLCEQADIRALAATWSCGLEAAGRRQRYARLSAVAREHGAPCVVTAHHRDDQAETTLMHVLRGSHGLVGMPATRALAGGVTLVRPLLAVRRADLRSYAVEHGIPWNEDDTNRDTFFRRNQIRHAVLPVLEAGCPGFTDALVAGIRTSEHPLRAWLRQRGLPVSRGIIRRLLALPSGGSLTLGGRRVVRLSESANVGWSDGPEFPHALPELSVNCPGTFDRDGWRLELSATAEPVVVPRVRRPGCGMISTAAIIGQLHWRSLQPGERWQPLGCAGHQSVMTSAAAAGVPVALRSGLSVLADDDGPLWLACGTIAERARITTGAAWLIRVTLIDDVAPKMIGAITGP